MLSCSLIVFFYIMMGGVVSEEIKKSIRFKDLIFGCFFFLLLAANYSYKVFFQIQEQWTMYDTHMVHMSGNILLLESLALNRAAAAYWRVVLRTRWFASRMSWFVVKRGVNRVVPENLGQNVELRPSPSS